MTMSPFDEHVWRKYAQTALGALLAAPIGSIAPDRVLGMDDFAKMAAQYADEMVKLQRARFSPPGQPSGVQAPEEPVPASVADSGMAASDAEQSAHQFFDTLFSPSPETAQETPPDR